MRDAVYTWTSFIGCLASITGRSSAFWIASGVCAEQRRTSNRTARRMAPLQVSRVIMISMTRRTFVAATAAASLAQAKKLATIGVQLYTVRSILPEKPAETLEAIDKLDYRECEVVRANVDKIWDSLKRTKLRPVSIHL